MIRRIDYTDSYTIQIFLRKLNKNLHWMSTKVDGVTTGLIPLLSAEDFLLFCFRRMENQSRENQTRFCSLSLTTPPPAPDSVP